MKKNIWRFSIGGLLIFMTLAAVVVAVAANYPVVAGLIMFGALWVLAESGAIVHIIEWLSKPSVYLRHPFLVAGATLVMGLPALALSGFCLFTLWDSPNRNWMGLIPIVLFGAFGIFCLTPLCLLVKYSSEARDGQHTNGG